MKTISCYNWELLIINELRRKYLMESDKAQFFRERGKIFLCGNEKEKVKGN